jgi:phage portal protein BeeE
MRVQRGGKDVPHPLLDLLGPAGRPNDHQDSFEFLSLHYAFLRCYGNSFWYWRSVNGGPPDEVHLLMPEEVTIVPGIRRVVDGYLYRVGGVEDRLLAESVTHFKGINLRSRYYGSGVLNAAATDIRLDAAASQWNYEFFDSDVFIPTGILVVDSQMPEQERERLEQILARKYGEKRRTAVVGGQPGSTAYYQAGAAQRDADYLGGREMARKAIFDAVGMPPGLLSERSTEANARVGEGRLNWTAWRLTHRTARRLTADALPFYTSSAEYRVVFDDLRQGAGDGLGTGRQEQVGSLGDDAAQVRERRVWSGERNVDGDEVGE